MNDVIKIESIELKIKDAMNELSNLSPLMHRKNSDVGWAIVQLSSTLESVAVRKTYIESWSRLQGVISSALEHKLLTAKTKLLEEKKEKENNLRRREILDAKISKLRHQTRVIEMMFPGIIQDLDVLMKSFRSLSEKNAADDTIREYIHKQFGNALRDVRSTNRISNGVQEIMENLGINPTSAIKHCFKFLNEKEGKEEDNFSRNYLSWLDEMYSIYKKSAEERVRLNGFTI